MKTLHLGLILVLAATASGEEVRSLNAVPRTYQYPKTVPERVGSVGTSYKNVGGSQVVVGYEPIYGFVEEDSSTKEAEKTKVVEQTIAPDTSLLESANRGKVIVGYEPIYGFVEEDSSTKEAENTKVVEQTIAADTSLLESANRGKVIVGYKPIYGHFDEDLSTKEAEKTKVIEQTIAPVVESANHGKVIVGYEPIYGFVEKDSSTKEAEKTKVVEPTIAADTSLLESANRAKVIVGYKPIYGYHDEDSTKIHDVTKLSEDFEFICPKRYGFYRYKQSCDIYVECRAYEAIRKVCPDGMHFKEYPSWAEYPCAYPPEAKCLINGDEFSAEEAHSLYVTPPPYQNPTTVPEPVGVTYKTVEESKVVVGYEPIYGLVEKDLSTKEAEKTKVKEQTIAPVRPLYATPAPIQHPTTVPEPVGTTYKNVEKSKVVVGYEPIYGIVEEDSSTKEAEKTKVKEQTIAPVRPIYATPPPFQHPTPVPEPVGTTYKNVEKSKVVVGYEPIYGILEEDSSTKEAEKTKVKEQTIAPVRPIYATPPPFQHPTPVPEPVGTTYKNVDKSKVVVGYEPIYGIVEEDPTGTLDVTKLSEDFDFKCQKRYAYYRYKQSCDIYVECKGYKAVRKVCPDGMHFKENPKWSEYPCAYPPEAKCLIRGGELPARPTAECPHQFGNYPLVDVQRYGKFDRCSSYISCSAGVAHVMNCTFGLVFNPEINLCDWPEQVPGCRDIFEFRCPVPHLGEEDMVINYRYAKDPECRYFYSCLNGSYRVLACDEGLYFDPRVGRCVEDDNFVCKYDNA